MTFEHLKTLTDPRKLPILEPVKKNQIVNISVKLPFQINPSGPYVENLETYEQNGKMSCDSNAMWSIRQDNMISLEFNPGNTEARNTQEARIIIGEIRSQKFNSNLSSFIKKWYRNGFCTICMQSLQWQLRANPMSVFVLEQEASLF